MYWDAEFAKVLETWGVGTSWHEIKFLLAGCQGKVLDIACGTGRTMRIVADLPTIDVYGCDISDYLIGKAAASGIPNDHLLICDATKTDYADHEFEYSYSIGSLEHFTEVGIAELVQECCRITAHRTFHMIPISRSGKDEGWMKTVQSFHNNSIDWWLLKFRAFFPTSTRWTPCGKTTSRWERG